MIQTKQNHAEMSRIAFVHNNFPAGGAERITLDIARYLHGFDGKYRTFAYVTRTADDMLSDEIRSFLTIRTISSQAVMARRAKDIERLIIEDQIDILVLVAKSLPGIEGIKERTGCKVVMANHGEPFWQRYAIVHRRQNSPLKKVLWRVYYRRLYQDGSKAMKMAVGRSRNEYDTCDAYTVLCEAYRHETAAGFGIDVASSHIHAIENPEQAVKDICWEKEKMILFCGRFEGWSKRVDRLLRIWGKIEGKLPDWRLVLVGDGPAGKEWKEQAEKDGLKRVHFEGRRTNVKEYYDKASVVCLTSETEGWPLALTEAQANGCIPVAFGSTSGIKDILGPDGKNGFIIPPFDEDLYAATLLKIASMSGQQQLQIRQNAVRKRLQYTPEIIAEKWRVLFDGLTGYKQEI